MSEQPVQASVKFTKPNKTNNTSNNRPKQSYSHATRIKTGADPKLTVSRNEEATKLNFQIKP